MDETNDKKRVATDAEQPAKKARKAKESEGVKKTKSKKPYGHKAEQQIKKYAGKNILLLKYAPVRRICKNVAHKMRPKTRFSEDFIHTIACVAQTEMMQILNETLLHSKFNNSLDDEGYPKTVATKNLENVLCMRGEISWPERKKKESESMPHTTSICDRIKPTQ